MPPRRERQSPDREERDARRKGRPAGNPEMERQIRDLRVRLEEMETTQRHGAGTTEFNDSEVEEELDMTRKKSQWKMHQQKG
jgi:hypothetical protein